MAYHPREGRRRGRRGLDIHLDRRSFLRRSAVFGATIAATPTLLAACGGDDDAGSSNSSGVVKLSRPDDPATLPLFDDLPAIADGLEPETGTLKLFNYPDYINPETVAKFEDELGVTVEITTFTTMDEAVEKLRAGNADFDVFFPTPDVVGKVVAGKLLQPLNPTYLPNTANVWPSLQDPFYDQGSRYTAPYTLYTTGIGYRLDEVSDDPFAMENPYDLLWTPAYSGNVWILDDDREALSMALLRAGATDVNTTDPDLVAQAGADLSEMIDVVNVKVGIEAYSKIPEGAALVHQAWSGDLVNAQYYLPEGTAPEVLGYWYPPEGGGVIGSDTMAIPASATKPVLAHRFIDFMLTPENALDNYSFLGYQPPQNGIDPERLIADGYVTEQLKAAVVRPEDFDAGYQILQLDREGEALWDETWSKFQSGT